MKKLVLSILTVLFISLAVQAKPAKFDFEGVIKESGVDTESIAVSIKSADSGKIAYSLNDKMLMNPASVQKLLTTPVSVEILGEDYEFKTEIYSRGDEAFLIKLGADPYLTSSDLRKLASHVGVGTTKVYIDDRILDSKTWGEGWQWDDDLNPLMPKFSAYNINKNLLKLEINPTVNNVSAKLTVKPFYPLTFMNLVTTDSKNATSVKVERNNNIAPNMLNVSGVVSKTASILIPVNNPKMNFTLRLEDAIRAKKLEYYATIKNAKLPDQNIYHVETVEHDLSAILPVILKYSDNLAAETVFKTAGAEYSNSQGNIENSLKMLNDYFEKNNLQNEDIKIVDGSGVSKNNLMTAKFMGEFLMFRANSENFEGFKNALTTAGEGTLKNRMLYFKDNLRAKTGTLADTSAMAGYITSRRGKLYAFDIMINGAKTSSADKKNIEEQILRNIYINY